MMGLDPGKATKLWNIMEACNLSPEGWRGD